MSDNERPVLRLGVTMRLSQAAGYDEPRDALARDWTAFLACALPEAVWRPIPNLGPDVGRHLEAWPINGLILTGGDDFGGDAPRDLTERILLDLADREGWPVFGVCRGLQLLWERESGQPPDSVGGHVGTRHLVDVLGNEAGVTAGPRVVNSFHSRGLDVSAAPGTWHALALDDQGHVEAAIDVDRRRAGVMWHPERENPISPEDVALVRWTFS